MSDWLDRLERAAPNLVGSFRALDDGRFIALRREVRRLAGAGSAVRLAREHAAVVAHLDGLIAAASPGGLPGPAGGGGALRGVAPLRRRPRPHARRATGAAGPASRGGSVVSPIRPDLVECWVFRVPAPGAEPEFLLIRRAPGRIFTGLWQCVTGGLHDGERV